MKWAQAVEQCHDLILQNAFAETYFPFHERLTHHDRNIFPLYLYPTYLVFCCFQMMNGHNFLY